MKIRGVTGAVGLVSFACGEPVPLPEDVHRDGTPLADNVWSSEIAFEGGVTIDRVRVAQRIHPNEMLPVRFRLRGVEHPVLLRLTLAPPRVGGREVALGGIDAPPRYTSDERSRSTDVLVGSEESELQVFVPASWDASTAMLTVEVLEPRRRAIRGPRVHTGAGILALVDVAFEPTQMIAEYAANVVIDGRLDDAAWSEEGHPLLSVLDGEPHRGRSWVWLAWNDEMLWVAADLHDTRLRASSRHRGGPLQTHDALEVFVVGSPSDLEYTMSPDGSRFQARRQGESGWASRGRSAVSVTGTLDDGSDIDEGWRVEMALPWTELCPNLGESCSPRAGARLRMNIVQFDELSTGRRAALSLSPVRQGAFHHREASAIVELRR